ncbi:response regulator [Methylobacterium sp. ap11]|uniref:response regulator n=1 Tax=Methylobacterium sp. ap11 TaxID=1761799 RepID=UPI000B814FC5|nr:response regulator [Methylobacterium sp. ap11]
MSTPEPNNSAGVITAVASLVSALAWPALVGIVFYAIYSNSAKLSDSLNKFMADKQSAKLGISATGGFTFEIVEKTAAISAQAVVASAKNSTSGSLTDTQAAQVALSAQSAAISLSFNALDPQKRLKVLWVDDHPENNIDLQFAFQALGIVVICIDSNERIQRAFEETYFDAVITDMARDNMGNNRPADMQGGLKTVDIIRKNYPTTKVIIYAAQWAASHRNDNLQNPVVLITNYTQDVYREITELATRKSNNIR